jgi:large subunit ribosomal protein L4
MKLEVINTENKKVAELAVADGLFDRPVRIDILSRVIEWQLSKRRQGTHKTKEVGEVSGTTKKMYRQKGTGSARHGSKRRAQFRGGAVIFGPVVRDHGYTLPKKVRKLGLITALSSKFQSGDLVIVDKFALSGPKTKDLKGVLEKIGVADGLLIDASSIDHNVALASGNLHDFDVLPQIGANVYDIMQKQKLIITVDAVKALEARLK